MFIPSEEHYSLKAIWELQQHFGGQPRKCGYELYTGVRHVDTEDM